MKPNSISPCRPACFAAGNTESAGRTLTSSGESLRFRAANTVRVGTFKSNGKVRAALFALREGIGYVCPGSETRRIRDWRRWFKHVAEKAGIVDFRWHDRRHTLASRLVLGTELRTVQELMGHKRIEMTLRHAHLSQPHLREAVERFSAMPTDTTTSSGQTSTPQTQVAQSA